MEGEHHSVADRVTRFFIYKSIQKVVYWGYYGIVFLVFLAFFRGLVIQAQVATPEQAIKLMQMGRFSEAEKIWRQLALTDPKDLAVHANLGLVLAHQGQYRDAADEYRKALALNPNQPDVEFDLGLAEFKQGHFAAAVSAFKSVAAVRQVDGRIQMLLGMSYYGEYQYSKAVPYLTSVDKLQPSNIELHYVLAESCLRSLNAQCAISKCKQILEMNPQSAQAHMLLGEALDGTNKTKDAINEFLAAERVAPGEPGVHFGLGYLYWELHDYDQAVPEFELELKNDPKNAQSDTYLGDIAYRNNHDASAESLLKKAIHLQGNIRLAYFDLGCVEARQKHNLEAIANFQDAEKLDPQDADAHYRLGRIYMSLGRKQQAAEEFAKTKELNQKTKESLIDKISGKKSVGLH
jgi:tetratricopeptide (TPR) repeat protein